jgi:hypothetical protein
MFRMGGRITFYTMDDESMRYVLSGVRIHMGFIGSTGKLCESPCAIPQFHFHMCDSTSLELLDDM